jgi:general secretion pathway protein G
MRNSGNLRRRAVTLAVTGIGILISVTVFVSMAIPAFTRSRIRAQEKVLYSNLNTLRTVIDNYTCDRQKAPRSLRDLVTEGYLRAIPTDPMNNQSTDWRIVMEDATQAANQQEPGIWDVHSSSGKTGLDGRPYSEW